MGLKWKIISSVMLLIIVITGVFITLAFQFSRKSIERHINLQVDNVQSVVDTIDEYHKTSYRSRIKSFLNHTASPTREVMVKAFDHRDRAELLQRSTPFLKLLKKEYAYFSTLAWITPDNINFLRVHNPGKFGDDIRSMRPDVVTVNRTQKQYDSYAVAGTGLVYTVVHPVLYNGKHLGAVQFGIKGDFLLDAVDKNLHAPVGLLIPNEKYRFVVRPLLPALPGTSHTVQSRHLSFFEKITDQVDWNLDRQRVQLQDKTYVLVKVLSLLNHERQLQGNLVVALEISQPLAEINRLFAWIIVLSCLLLIGSFLILYFSFTNLLRQITGLNQSLQQNNTKLAQQTNQLQQERDRFMNGPVMTFTWPNGESRPVEYASENVQDILGYSAEEFINGSTLYMSLVHPDDQERVRNEIKSNVADKETSFIHEPYRLTTRTGDTVWVLDTTTIIRDHQNQISHFQGYLVDITTTMRMEEEILAAKERLEFIIEGARLGTWDWKILTGEEIFNDRCAEILGYRLDELEQDVSTWKKLVHPDDAEEVKQNLKDYLGGRIPAYMTEHRLRHKSGKWVWVFGTGKVIEQDNDGKPLRIVGILLDINSQKEQEERRLQTSRRKEELKRLDSLQTMAGAIAHRFNNSMMAVQGNLELMTLTLPEDTEEHKMASNAARAARGAAKVGSMMLSYVGQQPLQFKEQTLADLVQETIAGLDDMLQPPVSLIFTPPSQPLSCSMDPAQIKEVVESILINSVESLENGAGTVEISLGSEYCARNSFPLPFQNDDLKDGVYAFCRIKDNGHGISPENLSRIFEPFYTTRFLGRGLGLALTVGIMRSHHGAITVESKPGEETTFTILLPALPPSLLIKTLTTEEKNVDRQLSGDILLADDEEMLLTVGGHLLQQLGFTVHTAKDGQDAVDRVRRRDIDFCAIILDISMPVLNGIQAMQEIRKIDPALPIILSSGYPEEEFSFQEDQGYDCFLSKPFQLADMRCCIEKVLI